MSRFALRMCFEHYGTGRSMPQSYPRNSLTARLSIANFPECRPSRIVIEPSFLSILRIHLSTLR